MTVFAMHPLRNMYSMTLADIAERDRLKTEDPHKIRPAILAFVVIGATAEPLTSEETDKYQGQTNYVDAVLSEIDSVVDCYYSAVQAEKDFPGVFLYDVAEMYGLWLRHNIEAPDVDKDAELGRLSALFFGQ